MVKKYLFAGLISLVALGLIGFEMHNRPYRAIRASLAGVAKAIDDGNWEAFSQYVDVDSVSASLARTFLDRMRREVAQEGVASVMEFDREIEYNNAESAYTLQLQLELQKFIQKTMLDSLRIWAQVPLEPFVIGPWTEPPLPDRLELGRAVFEGVTAIERDGRSATAVIAIRYDVLDTTFMLPIGLFKQDKTWRVVDVSGLERLADAIDARKDRIVQRANAEIIGDDPMIYISETPSVYFISRPLGYWGSMGNFESVMADFYVANLGDKPVKNLRFKLFVKAFPRNYVVVNYDRVIMPNANSAYPSYSATYVEHSLLHRIIKAKAAEALAIQLIGYTIVDGDQEIKRYGYESWEMMHYQKMKETES